jgi:hypothetical protein
MTAGSHLLHIFIHFKRHGRAEIRRKIASYRSFVKGINPLPLNDHAPTKTVSTHETMQAMNGWRFGLDNSIYCQTKQFSNSDADTL